MDEEGKVVSVRAEVYRRHDVWVVTVAPDAGPGAERDVYIDRQTGKVHAVDEGMGRRKIC
jgi:hypothetical protein